MQIIARQMNVNYERPFEGPLFSVPKLAVEILDGLYGALNPDFPLAMSDLTATTGNSMSDIVVRVRLFSGNGGLEITPEKFSASFQKLQSKEDLKTVENVVLLSEATLEKSLGEKISYSGARFGLSLWFECKDGVDGVRGLLEKYGTLNVDLPVEKIGAETAAAKPRGTLYNDSEGWRIEFLLEPSQLTGTHLYFACDCSYTESGKYINFNERTQHLDNITKFLLEHHELTLAADR